MKKLLIKIWRGEVNLKSARNASIIISILVPIIGIGSFFYRVDTWSDKNGFLYGTFYFESFFTINLAVGSFILFLSLIVLGRSALKQGQLIKISAIIYMVCQAIPLIFYVIICLIMVITFNYPHNPYAPYEKNSPEARYKMITTKNVPKGARIVFSSPPENRRPIIIVLDASEMDLTKWINETEFFLNKEYWSDQESKTRVTRKMYLADNPRYMKGSESILKCDTRTKEKPEDKYFLKICDAIKNNHKIWHLYTNIGQRCCRLYMYAFKKEKIILALGTGW